MKTVVAFLLACFSCFAWGEWAKVVERNIDGKVMGIYIDPSTVRKNGNLRRAMLMTDLKDGGIILGSVQSFSEFDCWENRMRLISMTAFSGSMGEGTIVEHQGEVAQAMKKLIGVWDAIPPGRGDEFALRYVCAR